MNPEIDTKIKELGLTVESKFVPFSQSRNKNEKYPSLNWLVTLKRNGRKILSTDYMSGSGHCPSYRQNDNSIDHALQVKTECETGFKSGYVSFTGVVVSDKKKPILPDIKDVLYSLLMDSDALDYEFSEWASNFGYEEDSRKAEKIYNECVNLGLQMQRALGQDKVQELREVYQDY